MRFKFNRLDTLESYKDGMYYCKASGTEAEGVAKGKSPLCPFISGKKINTKVINKIDPCVFMDDYGKPITSGQFSAKIAKLRLKRPCSIYRP